MKSLTVQEYMEMVGAEGLLRKSLAGETMMHDGSGSYPIAQILGNEEEEDETTEQEEEEDGSPASDGAGLDEPGETEFTLTISTDDEDRVRDILDPMGCYTVNFKSNPLFLYEHGGAHLTGSFSPDAVLGQIKSITQYPDKIKAHAKYFPRVGNTLVDRVLDMERKGLIPGNSMGWIPLDDITLLDNGSRKIGKWELIEVSKVVVPMNGHATNRRMNH